ncbi:hypothetical protein NDU88_003073 [Pleurodeles waltl]|uniref:Uncharacterized protein n=1 Tax=Pleurodeles waltl TaxID=8319 RepID=A0AAV7LFN0_PLEWA|nr:hypothetical protein NDU88_003073 [Pleurodeles waltl]
MEAGGAAMIAAGDAAGSDRRAGTAKTHLRAEVTVGRGTVAQPAGELQVAALCADGGRVVSSAPSLLAGVTGLDGSDGFDETSKLRVLFSGVGEDSSRLSAMCSPAGGRGSGSV